jgi:hypothetical protein
MRRIVGDDEYLPPKDAAPLIGPRWDRGVARTTVRRYLDEGLLRGYRKGKDGRRMVERSSIDALNHVLEIRDWADRTTALERLKRQNRRQAAGGEPAT